MQVLTVQIEARGQFLGCLQLCRPQTVAVKLARIILKHTHLFGFCSVSTRVNRTFELAPYGRISLRHYYSKKRRCGKSNVSSEAYRCSAPLKEKTKEAPPHRKDCSASKDLIKPPLLFTDTRIKSLYRRFISHMGDSKQQMWSKFLEIKQKDLSVFLFFFSITCNIYF